jgi:hypothetical protein
MEAKIKVSMQKISFGVIVAIALTGIVISALAASLLLASQTVPTSGNLKAVGVGVYSDSGCSNNVTSIDWGFLAPEAQINKTVYIRNNGNVPITLNITTNDWNPMSTQNYITLRWNREGYVLGTSQSTRVTQAFLILSVSSTIAGITNFSFSIIITGTEQA